MTPSTPIDSNLADSSPSSTGASSNPVGLLVVHGIGSQKRGETLNGVLDGVCVAYGDRLHIQREDEEHATIAGLNRPVHVFEVFWADLLHGATVKGTFDMHRIVEVAWFPVLNRRSGLYQPEAYSPGTILGWTWILVPLGAFLTIGIWGARFLAAIFSGHVDHRRMADAGRDLFRPRRDAAQDSEQQSGGFWERVRALRNDPNRGRTILDDLLDEVVGDVFNYVHGVGEAFPETSDRNEELARNVGEIHARFLETAERASSHGCREIQVLAHSLGTVVAFRSMCRRGSSGPPTDAPARVSRFYTIGSPLEKIRFFWPRLVECSPDGPVIVSEGQPLPGESGGAGESAMRWDNFHSRGDLVSGRLRPFEGWPRPVNHKARGLGGMIRSHGAYNRNPDFLALLGEGLTGEAPHVRVSRLRHLAQRLAAALENLVLPAVLLFLTLFGAAVMGGTAWGTGWLVTQPLEWLGLDAWAQGVRVYFLSSTFFVMTVVGAVLGRSRARELHDRFWAPKEPRTTDR